MRIFPFASLVFSLGLAVVLSGCGGSTTTTNPPPANPSLTVAPAAVAIAAGQTAQFTATTNVASSSLQWEVNGIAGGNSTLGTVSSSGLYTAPANLAQTVTVTVLDLASPSAMANAQVSVVGPGAVATTGNGQVAAYTITLPSTGTVAVNFGTSTSYGRNTWQVPSPANGGATTVLVAGMNADSAYHMQAVVTLANGLSFTDADHTFNTTESVPASLLPAVTTSSPGVPAPGVVLLSDLQVGALAYDLKGNMVWGYNTPEISYNDEVQPARLLPDGNMMVQITPLSGYPLDGLPPPEGSIFEVREVDLGNTIIRSLTMAKLQANLNATGYRDNQDNPVTILDMHHDVIVNPTTGHWVILGMYAQNISGLTGYTKPVTVFGDIILDVDPAHDFAVKWIFDEFKALDVNRHPYQFPDWTHTNALLYSADDGNLLISVRHQSWVIKVNYKDGTGDSSVMWRLGYQGDFQLLQNGVADTNTQDWQYQEHEPAFTTTATSGVFGLTMMDNGDQRVFSPGATCPVALTSGQCLYSRTPIFTVDETMKTADLSNGAVSPVYSYFGGNAGLLANGDQEADFCGAAGGAQITEMTVGDSPTLVWKMTTVNSTQYRGHRLGSLYPGVTWQQ
jgi:arylsulfate sulfotransferase